MTPYSYVSIIVRILKFVNTYFEIISNFLKFLFSAINIPPHSGGYFIFGRSPNPCGCAQVRLKLTCQPRIGYLLPVNGSSVLPSPAGKVAATKEQSDEEIP